MSARPRLSELRAKAHKGRHREIGNMLARFWGRPLAIYGTWLAVRLGLSANQVTLMALIATLGGAGAIGTGTPWGFVAGVGALHLAFWLDHVDGQVARWCGTVSLDGTYFDYLYHYVWSLSVGFALGLGLASRTGQLLWTVAGAATAMGWMILSLHNDATYKAFFQRLKSTRDSYCIEGGLGGRPSEAPPWPKTWPGILTYPAYKAQEPHVVLGGLTALAPLALFGPEAWRAIWTVGLAGTAVLAPALAIARAARSINSGATEKAFSEWFRSLPSERERA